MCSCFWENIHAQLLLTYKDSFIKKWCFFFKGYYLPSHFFLNFRNPPIILWSFLTVVNQFFDWLLGCLRQSDWGAARCNGLIMQSLGFLRTWPSQRSLYCLTIMAVGWMLQQQCCTSEFDILLEHWILRIFCKQQWSKTPKWWRWSAFSGQVLTA